MANVTMRRNTDNTCFPFHFIFLPQIFTKFLFQSQLIGIKFFKKHRFFCVYFFCHELVCISKCKGQTSAKVWRGNLLLDLDYLPLHRVG